MNCSLYIYIISPLKQNTMKNITYLFILTSCFIYAQQQFPGENENNIIINAGFENAPIWNDCDGCKNDDFGWEGYLCQHLEDKFEVYTGTSYRVSVPSADGDYYALTKEFDASIYQVIEVDPNTQYTVKYKFGWINFNGRSIDLPKDNSDGYKEINAVITNNQTGANKVILKKFSHRNNDYYSLGSQDQTFATAFFDSWNDVEWTFSTSNETTVRLAMWKMNGTPPYILDNVEIFPTPQANVNKFKNAMFSLSPNPASNTLNLKASKTITKIDIFNVMGQRVSSKPINALNSIVNISALNKGIYVMNVTIDDNIGTYRFIKE